MKKIRIAQIGTSQNSHGCPIWRRLLRNTDIFDVAGYAFPENEREKFPREATAFDGYREMTVDEILADPDIEAVTIETEEIYLTKYALMAARAGKHIHMEKPGGTDPRDFRELIEVLRSKNLTFSTGYMYRFNPLVREALDKIKRGELGEIYSVEAHMSCKHSSRVRKWLENFPGGMLFFLGCHLIDIIYQILGEPSEIIPLSCSTGIDGITTQDYGMVIFKYPNGVSFAKTCDNELGGVMRRQVVICGEKGSININPIEVAVPEGQYAVLSECRSTEFWGTWEQTQSEVHDRYDAMMRNFAELVRGKENPYSYDYELGLYELLIKACGERIK